VERFIALCFTVRFIATRVDIWRLDAKEPDWLRTQFTEVDLCVRAAAVG
jgi:hypothetical protein|tara:strand:+ start:10036 stop:10182 length:147 start_codon:yes stop_codon:yes gene_type:complete